MAGIGFELRKMFAESDSTFGDIKAIAYSTVISVGPWIITAISLNLLLFIAKGYIYLREERVIFMATVLYAFIFSQILVSPWQYVVTRYVSDCIYKGQTEKLRGAFIGIMKLTMIMAFIIARIFFKGSPLSASYKGISTVLFTVLSASWICISFVSVVKNYSFVAYSYIFGNIVAVILGLVLGRLPIEFTKNMVPTNLLIAYTIGIIVTFVLLSYHLLSSFKGKEESEFAFLKYLRGYKSLFFIGFFYTTGSWTHLFVTWFRGDFYIISGTFRTAAFYEVALFYAFFITIPSMVYFIVFLETKFFPDYKKYYAYLSYKGTLDDIEESKLHMMDTLRKELYYCMELQLFISLSLALTANIIFNYYEMDLYLLELFRIFIFSAYCVIIISIVITILLYLDAKTEALIISFTFMLSNFTFTYFLAPIGPEYNGLGFFFASFVSLILARNLLAKSFNQLTYTTFYYQNFEKKVGSKFLSLAEAFLNKRGYIPVLIALLIAGLASSCTRYNKQGFNNVSRRNWHTMSLYGLEGYDGSGYNRENINRRGFDKSGYNTFTESEYDFFGFNSNGINKDTNTNIDLRGFDIDGIFIKEGSPLNGGIFDEGGFDRLGVHRDTNTEYNTRGWTYFGLNKDTNDYYDSNGFNIEGFNIDGFDKDGYDIEGFDKDSWNREGINRFTSTNIDPRGFFRNGTHSETKDIYDNRGFDIKGKYYGQLDFDPQGYDFQAIHKDTGTIYNPKGWSFYGINKTTEELYDKNGFNRDGYDIEGYNSKGYSIDGFNRDGFNSKGYNIDGFDKNGYDFRGYDADGFDRNGWNRKGWNKFTNSYYDFYGFKRNGIHKVTKTRYNEFGWNQKGINRDTKTKFDIDGYDINGLDRKGRARTITNTNNNNNNNNSNTSIWRSDGTNTKTGTIYDENGYNFNGIDKDGFNREGVYVGD